jgi:hypothetical protein
LIFNTVLPDGRVALSQRLTTALAAVVGPRLVPETGRAFTKAGDPSHVTLPVSQEKFSDLRRAGNFAWDGRLCYTGRGEHVLERSDHEELSLRQPRTGPKPGRSYAELVGGIWGAEAGFPSPAPWRP